MLKAEKILSNWTEFRKRVEQFNTRSENLNKLYDSLDERICMLPASSVEYYHNTFEGGYVDHVLRVMDYCEEFYQLYKKLGLITDNFTYEELMFSAMHHDLGKIGFPGVENTGYKHNDSKWHRENRGMLYKSNDQIPFGTVQDKSLFLLQYYNVPCTWNEWQAIRTHDGPFEKVNEPYWISTNLQNKMRTNLATILHQADYAAARWEFERWAKTSRKFNMNVNFSEVSVPVIEPVDQKPNIAASVTDIFNQTFGNL